MELPRLFKTVVYVGIILPFLYAGSLNSAPTSPTVQDIPQSPRYDSHRFDSQKPNPTTNPGYKAGVNPQGYHLPPQRKLPPAPLHHPESSSGQQKYHPGGGSAGGGY